MKLLVTGTEGYIGILLADLLTRQGHDVTGVDTGFYKGAWLYSGLSQSVKTLHKDIRNLDASDLAGMDAVIHLAELSNDPIGQLAPHITYDINHRGSVRLAQLAKDAGIERFIYTSSCSVYGVANEDEVRETSDLNPQTAYAECKALVERDVTAMAAPDFSPTFLRNATAFGASPRMRFDLVVNNLSGLAWTTREIKMTSDGSPWRPLVHILDICKAIGCVLAAPRDTIHNQIFNVGDASNNYQVRQIAEMVAEVFPGCAVSFGELGGDNRSYRVDFSKINTTLPGFKCDWSVMDGIRQLHGVFQQIGMDKETFEDRDFTRLKQLEHLIRTQQINDDFFWRLSTTQPEHAAACR